MIQDEYTGLIYEPTNIKKTINMRRYKFRYENMLNAIMKQKINKIKAPNLTPEQIDAWNNAVELCFNAAKKRQIQIEELTENINKTY